MRMTRCFMKIDDLNSLGVSRGDYPEDFNCENGRYMHECYVCGNKYIGHKYRKFVCKVCKAEEVDNEK